MLSIHAQTSLDEAAVSSTSKMSETTGVPNRVYTKEKVFGIVATDIDGTEDIANFSDWLSPSDASNIQLPVVSADVPY
jgi:hypothetical protein